MNPMNHPTLLRIPTWYGGLPDEVVLPLPCIAYEVRHEADRSVVTVIETGECVYCGIGPAEVAVSPAPF